MFVGKTRLSLFIKLQSRGWVTAAVSYHLCIARKGAYFFTLEKVRVSVEFFFN